jgi:Fe-S cluster assembly iron-binding protein IscA
MLTVSEDAATLIQTLTGEAEDVAGQAGLRIVVDSAYDSLSMDVVTAAEPLDVVVVTRGTNVFLSESAARRLTNGTLGANTAESRPAFFLDR